MFRKSLRLWIFIIGITLVGGCYPYQNNFPKGSLSYGEASTVPFSKSINYRSSDYASYPNYGYPYYNPYNPHLYAYPYGPARYPIPYGYRNYYFGSPYPYYGGVFFFSQRRHHRAPILKSSGSLKKTKKKKKLRFK